MLYTVFKVALSALVIAFASWLAGKRPDLAGFIIALPLATLLVLPLSYMEYQDPNNAVAFGRSILIAVPLSLTFFIPFLAAPLIMPMMPEGYGFWGVYGLGLLCLIAAYFAHQAILKYVIA